MEQNNPNFTPSQPEIEIFKQFNENQAKELEIKLMEAQTTKDDNERKFIYAGKLLEAQERDMKDLREYMLKSSRYGGLAAVSIVLIICALFGFCVYMGSDQVVLELVKIICYGTPFGFGGFYWGRSKAQAEDKQQSTQA